MNYIAMYKKQSGKTLREVTEDLRGCIPNIDAPLVSKMINGVCRPSEALESYVCKLMNGVCDEILVQGGQIVQCGNAKVLKSNSAVKAYKALKAEGVCRDNPLKRSELCTMLGVTDRALRKTIQGLRECGVRVGCDSKGHGYWICDGEADYKQFRAELMSRANVLIKQVKAMDEYCEGQLFI